MFVFFSSHLALLVNGDFAVTAVANLLTVVRDTRAIGKHSRSRLETPSIRSFIRMGTIIENS